MTNLVDEKRLECLKNVGLCDVHDETWQEICQTLSLALKAVRAAQEMRKKLGITRELKESLLPFSQGEGAEKAFLERKKALDDYFDKLEGDLPKEK